MNMNADVPSLCKIAITHIVKRCNRLKQVRGIEDFGVYWSTIPRPIQLELSKNELILMARAHLCFHTGDYAEMYKILRTQKFSGNCEELRTLWWNARYAEAAKLKGRNLNLKDKYNVRKRFPCPTIIKKRLWGYNAITTLEYQFRYNHRPSEERILDLAIQLNMRPRRVECWFLNRRKREKELDPRLFLLVKDKKCRHSRPRSSCFKCRW